MPDGGATSLVVASPEHVEALNDSYDDSLLLVARILGDRRAANAAKAVSVDANGLELAVVHHGVEERLRVPFDEEVTDAAGLTAALFGLVFRARAASGEDGETTAEREVAARSRIRTFLTEVVAVADVGPHLRQVTFGGGLASFEPAGPDTFLYLLLPPPGRTELGIDESFTWEQHAAMDDAEKPVGAYYTLRRWRPEVGELDILMVLHGDEGPASAWAARAEPGDRVALWGPRTAYHPPAGTDELILVADETGLPAVAAIIEQRPARVPVVVLAEVGSAANRPPLPSADDVEVRWLSRDGAPPGSTTLLADAVRGLAAPRGTPYVWGGGESRAMTAVRRHVRDVWGLPRSAVSLVAYWRREVET